MIFGIGSDIVQISRIQKIYAQFSNRFLAKHFHATEIETFQTLPDHKKIPFLAKRFAAKEAMAKALGTGFSNNIKLKEIYVANNTLGKPSIQLDGNAAIFFNSLSKSTPKVHLSLSDEISYAIAFVVVEIL